MARVVYEILKDIACKRGYEMTTFCHDWIIKLSNGEKNFYTYGYICSGSDSVSQQFCKDKSSLYELLTKFGIDTVPHHLFMGLKKQEIYLEHKLDISEIVDFFKANGDIVVKDNNGGSGRDVYLIKSENQIEHIVEDLLIRDKDIAYCPYYDSECECRVVVYNGNADIMFSKERIYVLGDGQKTIRELIVEKFGKEIVVDKWIDLERIPQKEEKVVLSWMHNLRHGANPVDIVDDDFRGQLSEIACKVCKIIGIKFASVDILKVKDKLIVLEVNSALTLEKYAKTSKDNYQKVKNLYEKIVLDNLE